MVRHALALRKLAETREGSGIATIHLKPDRELRIAEGVHAGMAQYHGPDVIDRALEVLHAHDQWLVSAGRQRGEDSPGIRLCTRVGRPMACRCGSLLKAHS